MALSGQLIWGPISNGAYFSFEWTATQNTTARTSTVSWKMYGKGRSSSPTYIASNYHLSIDGSEVSALTGSWDGSSKFSFNNAKKDSGSFTVYHDSSGAGSFYAEIYAYISSGAYNWDTVGTTFSLDNIGSLGPYYSWYNLGQNDGTGSASVSFNLTANQVGYYWFKPPSDGTITIYSTGSTDTYGGFGTDMDLSSTQTYGGDIVTGESYSNDDSGDGSNFKCENIPVTGGSWAGQVFVHGYNNAVSGTLYIDFTPSNYVITFNANGGSGAPSAISCSPGESITIPTTKPTRSDRVFLGWSGSSTAFFCTKDYLPGSAYTPDANKTLYAVWGYKLTINPNGGSIINSSYYNSNGEGVYTETTDPYIVGFTKTSTYGRDLANFDANYWYKIFGDSKIFNIPVRVGHSFNGWTITSGNGQVIYEAPDTTHKQVFYSDNKYCYIRTVGTEYGIYYYINNETTPSNTTITAQWTPYTYYIAYNANGGSGTMSTSVHTYDTFGSLSINTFTRSGYKFIGWNTDPSATTALYTDGMYVANLTAVNGDTITLYAIWEISNFTVTLSNNQNWTGSYAPTGGGSYTPGASVTINQPIQTNWKFVKWTDSSGNTISTNASYTFTMPSSNVSYTANVARKAYTVRYDANGGTGTMASSSHQCGVAKNLTANTFTRLGYTFIGWSTSSTATSATYTNSQSVTNLSTTDGATVTLYAVWEPYSNMYIYSNGAWHKALKYIYTSK